MTTENPEQPQPLRFTKMHGLGNDFMVIDAISQSVNLNTGQIQRWADRHFGIGFDQLLLVEAPDQPDVDFRYRIFNSDGGEVEHCGNGARCFARFVREKGLTHKDTIRVSIEKGIIELTMLEDGRVQVDMGEPVFEPEQIPLIADQRQLSYPLTLDGTDEEFEVTALSMGNPHAVMLVKNVDSAPVNTLGPLLEHHSAFPERANIGFLQIIDRKHARLRVFERGAGETLACGTGACAAMVAGRLRGLLDDQVSLELTGGPIEISWSGKGSVMMTGPATTVFEGQLLWNNSPEPSTD